MREGVVEGCDPWKRSTSPLYPNKTRLSLDKAGRTRSGSLFGLKRRSKYVVEVLFVSARLTSPTRRGSLVQSICANLGRYPRPPVRICSRCLALDGNRKSLLREVCPTAYSSKATGPNRNAGWLVATRGRRGRACLFLACSSRRREIFRAVVTGLSWASGGSAPGHRRPSVLERNRDKVPPGSYAHGRVIAPISISRRAVRKEARRIVESNLFPSSEG